MAWFSLMPDWRATWRASITRHTVRPSPTSSPSTSKRDEPGRRSRRRAAAEVTEPVVGGRPALPVPGAGGQLALGVHAEALPRGRRFAHHGGSVGRSPGPGSGMPRMPQSAPGRTRTDTERFLRPLPLPLGYEGGRRGQHGAAWRRLKDRSCAGRSRAPRRRGRGTAAPRSGRSRAAARGPRTPPRSPRPAPPCPAAGRVRRSASARFTSPVRSGTLMQPSRAFSFREDSTTTALHSTKVPWCARVLGCSVTSTQNTFAPTPTCGAARPTQPGETRMVATRSAASCTVSGAVGSTASPTLDSTVAGARTTSETRPSTGRSCSVQRPTASSTYAEVTARRSPPRAGSPRRRARRRRG